MRAVGFPIAAFIVLPLAGCSGGGNAAKIIGTWEVVKGGGLPAGSTLEFAKDGKLKINVKADGKTSSLEGTYKVDDDKLTTTGKGANDKETTVTVKITKLTGSELILEDEKGRLFELKKK